MKITNPQIKFNYIELNTQIRSELVKYLEMKKQLENEVGFDPFSFEAINGQTFYDLCNEVQQWNMYKIEEIIKHLEGADEASGRLMNTLSAASLTDPTPD